MRSRCSASICLTGFNGQISLGHGAFFAIGGYGAAILTAKFGLPYWAAIPIASLVCFGAGFLFGFPALRFGGLYLALATFALAVATPQISQLQRLRRLDRRLAGLSLAKPHAAVRAASERRPVDLSLLPPLGGRALLGGERISCRGRIGRALIAIRDQPIAAETMGVNAALYKTTCFGVSALYAGVAGGLSAIAVGFVSPESFGLSLSLSFLVGIVVGGLASIGGVVFGALFIEFVPNFADQLSVNFGESAKALPGAIYGAAADPDHGRDADRGRGRAAGRRRASPTRGLLRKASVQVEGGGGPQPPRKEDEGGIFHADTTFIPAIERAAAAFAASAGSARRRKCAGRHRHRNQDRPDHAL